MCRTLNITIACLYALSAFQGVVAGVYRDYQLSQPRLSELCSSHRCGCSLMGSCDVSCCCASKAGEDEHDDHHSEPALVSCGRGFHVVAPGQPEPHFPPAAWTPPQLGNHAVERLDDSQEPHQMPPNLPDKIPISS